MNATTNGLNKGIELGNEQEGFTTKDGFLLLGQMENTYKTTKARRQFMKAWEIAWGTNVETAKLPAVRP